MRMSCTMTPHCSEELHRRRAEVVAAGARFLPELRAALGGSGRQARRAVVGPPRGRPEIAATHNGHRQQRQAHQAGPEPNGLKYVADMLLPFKADAHLQEERVWRQDRPVSNRNSYPVFEHEAAG